MCAKHFELIEFGRNKNGKSKHKMLGRLQICNTGYLRKQDQDGIRLFSCEIVESVKKATDSLYSRQKRT